MRFRHPFEVVVDRAVQLRVFCWDRVGLRSKVLSTLLYHSGLSYRSVSYAFLRSFSHEAVRLWCRRLLRALPKPEVRHRSVIAVDETKVKLVGEWVFIWCAIDVDSKEVLATRASYTRSSLDALLFIRKALEACVNKPKVLVDGGPWYPWALNELDLEWEHVTFGRRNRVERWFGYFKARVKAFSKSFPHNSSLNSLRAYTSSYAGWYNLTITPNT